MRKKRVVKIVILVVILVAYIARVIYLNRDISKSKVTYVQDTGCVKYDEMEVTLTNQVLYEMPAFVEAYPEMEKFYHVSTSLWAKSGGEELFRALKYVVEVRLAFYNTSQKKKEINLTAFQLVNRLQTISQGAGPYITEALNGAVQYKIAPGERKEIFLTYDLLDLNIRNLNYQRVKEEQFAVLISGYPHMQGIQLNHLPLVKAKGEYDPYKQEDAPVSQKVQKEDTPSGTILPVGGECYTGGVGVRVDSVDIVRNVKEFPDYQEDAWLGYFKSGFVNEDGTVKTIWEDGHGLPKSYYQKGYQNYIIFVTMRFKNYTNQAVGIYNNYALYNSKASWECPAESEYTTNLNDRDETDALKGVVQAGEEQVLVLGYARSIRKDQDIYKMPLYISNDATATEHFDLDKGRCGFGKFIRIQ